MHEYFSTCNTCQRLNYCNASSAIKLISIKIAYTVKCMCIALIDAHSISNPDMYRYVLQQNVLVNGMIREDQEGLLKLPDVFFNNFLAQYGTSLKLNSDNGPSFV